MIWEKCDYFLTKWFDAVSDETLLCFLRIFCFLKIFHSTSAHYLKTFHFTTFRALTHNPFFGKVLCLLSFKKVGRNPKEVQG